MGSFDRRHAEAVAAALAHPPRIPRPPLSEDDLALLPAPVQRFIRASGALGRPRPWNVRVEFDALMRRKPGGPSMKATSVQLNRFDPPARLFLMQSRMFGLPVRALHLYQDEAATFQVRILDLFNVVNEAGPAISRFETVTVLNDLCFMVPGALVDERLQWRAIDDRSAHATFTNGPHTITATLVFNERDELVDFWSDDRAAPAADGSAPMRWNTPIGEYAVTDGMRLPTWGAALWNRPDGPFTYGEFRVRSIRYDVS